jgi:hypothetical protein
LTLEDVVEVEDVLPGKVEINKIVGASSIHKGKDSAYEADDGADSNHDAGFFKPESQSGQGFVQAKLVLRLVMLPHFW